MDKVWRIGVTQLESGFCIYSVFIAELLVLCHGAMIGSILFVGTNNTFVILGLVDFQCTQAGRGNRHAYLVWTSY
jgi:hypothetical protein